MALTILGWTISWPLVGTLVALLLGREFWKMSYFWRQGINGPMPYPFIGNSMEVFKGMHHTLSPLHKKYGKVFGILALGHPVICIADPEIVKDITVKNFNKFMNHMAFGAVDKAFKKGLTILRGEHWKNVRNVITPTFSASKMKRMSPLINECCDTLIDVFRETQGKESELNIIDLFGGFSMDVIAKCAFGLDVDSQRAPDNPFTTHAKNILKPPGLLTMIGAIFPAIGRLMQAVGVRFTDPEAADFFMTVAEKALSMRKEQHDSERKDFMQLMANAHLDDDDVDTTEEANDLHKLIDEHHDTAYFNRKQIKKTKLTLEEITVQGLTFFIGGYETTSTTLSFLAYSLATNPGVQEKLIEEIEEYAPTRDSVDYSSVAKMPFLDSVICETLRLYPTLAVTERLCEETHSYNGITIRPGNQVFLDIFSMHRDPDLWPNPHIFDPARFTKENRAQRHPFAWIPFGAGPRGCIGMRFALLETKMAAVRLLQEFRFETSSKTQIPIKFGIASIKPKEGIFLRITDRKSTHHQEVEG